MNAEIDKLVQGWYNQNVVSSHSIISPGKEGEPVLRYLLFIFFVLCALAAISVGLLLLLVLIAILFGTALFGAGVVIFLLATRPEAIIGVAPPTPTPTPMAIPGQGRIVFHSERSGNFDIWLMENGGEPVQLTDALEADVEPAWSPDGTQIVFVSARDDPENVQLYIMNADGSEQRPLQPFEAADSWAPSWSPDGQRIVYQTNRDGNFEIYVINVDGTGRTNLINDVPDPDFPDLPLPNDGMPDWSPDGSKIVFVSDRGRADREIWIMDADGGNRKQLTDNDFDDARPRWSPDGKHILFESTRDGRRSIYIMDAEGGNVRRVTDATVEDKYPAWSNDGRAVLFSSTGGGIDWELYWINVDGSGLRRLTWSEGEDGYPQWVP